MPIPDWVPLHCVHCEAYMGHDEAEFVECGSDYSQACDCGIPSHNGGYKCPVCGNAWAVCPPEDWSGRTVEPVEEPFREPPHNRYGRSHTGYSRTQWGDA